MQYRCHSMGYCGTGERMDDVRIVELNAAEYEDTCYKNQYLQQMEEQYVVMILQDMALTEQIQEALQAAGRDQL